MMKLISLAVSALVITHSTFAATPTRTPTYSPTQAPTDSPTLNPTAPSYSPTLQPTASPIAGYPSELTSTYAKSNVRPYPPKPLELRFDDHVFGAIVLALAAAVSVHMCHGYGTRKTRESLIGLILLTMVGFQMYHLIRAALTVPATRFFVYNERFHRSDCMASGKGGKRPYLMKETWDENPCFCLPQFNCTSASSGAVISNSTCPTDASATCLTSSGVKVHPYISYRRNCEGGQGIACTKDEPCFPCERETLHLWGFTARCRTCSSDFTGECHFLPQIGPYCFEKPGSKKVVPCTRCCTEPIALVMNGTCY